MFYCFFSHLLFPTFLSDSDFSSHFANKTKGLVIATIWMGQFNTVLTPT